MRLFAFLLAAFFFHSAVALPAKVPAGFELVASEEQVVAEVVFMGRAVGQHEVIVSADMLRFVDAGGLLGALPLSVSAEGEEFKVIGERLVLPFSRNDELSCKAVQRRTACDYLEPSDLGVIYDEREAQVLLFMRKDWVAIDESERKNHVPTRAGVSNAFVHQQTVNFISDDGYESLYALGSGALGIGDSGYLGVGWDLTTNRSDTDANLNNLYYRRDIGERNYVQAGRMDASDLSTNLGGGFSFKQFPSLQLKGVRAGTTNAYLDLSAESEGSPVVVVLTRPSRVDVYRGEQLLGTNYFNAGTHFIDTRGYPFGAYTLTLRVYEGGQLVRRENTLFTLANRGSWAPGLAWFAQAGELAGEGSSALQAGVQAELMPGVGLTAGVGHSHDVLYSEAVARWTKGFESVQGVMDFEVSYLGSDEGSRGNTQQLTFTDGFSMSLNRSEMSARRCGGVRRSDLSGSMGLGCYESLGAYLSVPLSGMSLTGGYTRFKSKGAQTVAGRLPGDPPLVFSGETSRFQLGLSRAFSLGGGWAASGNTGFYSSHGSGNPAVDDRGVFISATFSKHAGDNASRTLFSSSGELRQTDHGGTQSTLNAAANLLLDEGRKELALEASTVNPDIDSVGDSASIILRGRADTRYGRLVGAVARTSTAEPSDNRTTFSGSYSSTLAVGSGGVYLGPYGQGREAGAVAVEVERDEDGGLAQARVGVEGGNIDLPAGAGVVLPVDGYAPARLSIDAADGAQAKGIDSLTTGAGEEGVFLLPGKLKTRTVGVQRTYLFVVKSVLLDGVRVEGARVINGVSYSDHGNGVFSTELRTKERALYLLTEDGVLLNCPLVVRHERDVVRYLGDLACRPAQGQETPEWILERAERRRERLAMVPAHTAARR